MSEQLTNPEELFRKEAIQFSESSRQGKVLIAHPVRLTVIIYLLIALFVITLLFSMFVDYEQTRSARGQIRPALQSEKVTAPQGTSIVEIFVSDGDQVSAGDPLFKVKNRNFDIQGNDLLESNKSTIQSTLELLNEQLEITRSSYKEKKSVLTSRMAIDKNKLNTLKDSLSKYELKHQLMKEQIGNFERLFNKNQISKSELYNKRIELIDFEIGMNQIKQDIDSIKNQILSTKEALIQLDLSQDSENSRLLVSIEDKKQMLIQISGEKEQIIKAGISGVVTNFTNSQGSKLSSSDTIMQIVPQDSPLLAEVYLASQDIAFVKKGQKVKLALDSFPYQKYGYASGIVSSISETAMGDLGTVQTINSKDNHYRVLVQLEDSSLEHKGKQLKFVPGMMLKGFIYGDKRSLFEWVFEPVYGLMERYQS
ncbi:HlyD family efflux transporter periplasmic adaptor subunit [Pleionea sediminis]|uniref:HlyD family efflux transporter periplasmic adaptor subunit n=1 Tax=Pleionea sediminis TaxID=2569479 RepID=UPI00118717A0|nr:HlyD family efflux transporter periplasmic adaptor subunit [Pleionea sediminis]